jgi:hypothetical protein
MRWSLPDPKRPADLLGRILRDARSLASRSETDRALKAALGPELAAHCRIAGMSGGRLLVAVDSAPLYAELRGFRAEEVRRRLNEQLGGRKVVELSFRPGSA